MILFSWLLTLLVAQLALGFDHKIDLERCGVDTSCFIHRACFARDVYHTAHRFSLFRNDRELKKDNECDVVLQMKTIDKLKLHVMMQVKLSGSNKMKIDEGLKLNQGDDQFVCKPEGITGAYDYKFVQSGRQIFEDQHLFCSFTAEILDKRKENIFDIYKHNSEDPILTYTDNHNDIKYLSYIERSSKKIWQELRPYTCSGDEISSSTIDSATDTSIVLTEVDTTLDSFSCTANSFVIRKKSEHLEKNTSDVGCSQIFVGEKGKYVWTYEEAGQMKEIDGDFEVFCPIKRCRLCPSAPPPLSCPSCAVTTYTGTGAYGNVCPTLTCATGKLTVTGESALDGDAECKRSTVDPTKYAWFVAGTELKQAACMDNSKVAAKRNVNAASAFEEYLTRAN